MIDYDDFLLQNQGPNGISQIHPYKIKPWGCHWDYLLGGACWGKLVECGRYWENLGNINDIVQ